MFDYNNENIFLFQKPRNGTEKDTVRASNHSNHMRLMHLLSRVQRTIEATHDFVHVLMDNPTINTIITEKFYSEYAQNADLRWIASQKKNPKRLLHDIDFERGTITKLRDIRQRQTKSRCQPSQYIKLVLQCFVEREGSTRNGSEENNIVHVFK